MLQYVSIKGQPMTIELKLNKDLLGTLADLTLHFVIACLLAWLFFRLTGAWLWPILSFIGGVLIDTDHLLDYFFYYGFKFSLKDFLGHKYLASGKSYLIFHSVEIILLVWVLSIFALWLIPLATGMTVHLLTLAFTAP